ncbi:MAG: hypothetical protein U0L11_07505 [Acutalibacteraceae bacterium]|nr:hypothetical protein [Acutalibacteraceae bacterium]
MPDFREIMYEILKMLLMISPFVLLCVVDKIWNMPKIDRGRQFLMPVLSVLLMAVVMVYADDINTVLINFIRYIPKFFYDIDAKLWLPDFIGDFFVRIGDKLKVFLDSLNLNFWIFFISNWVILGAYVLIKKGIIFILTGVYNSENETYRKLHDTVVSEFYEFFPERDKWCVKNSYSQARKLLGFFWIASIIISVVVMLFSRKLYDDKVFTVMFYPVFGVVILGELYFFLDGLTRGEYTQDVLGENENAYKNINYSLLRKFLRATFKDKLLAENTNVNNAFDDEITTTDIIINLEKNDDPKVVAFATYMDALNKTGFDIDNNYLKSSLDLLNGKSILFNNPFYNDHIPYAFYPMNRALLNHKKVLVILGRHSVEDDIAEWIERGIEAVTNIPFMWRTGVLGDGTQELDIGILTRSDVLNIKLHEANADFLEKVEYCVIIEPSKLISTAQIGLNLIVKKCRNDEDKNIVFCMFDKNCDGLVDAMSHILMTSISEVSATGKHHGTSSYMIWEADDEYVHHRMFPNISRYLGMGTELSFAGLKNQVSKATWFGGDAFPVTDMNWIDRQYYYELMKYSGLPTSQEAMDERFKTTPNYWSATVAEHNYFTVEDENCNMFEILREFQTRSTEQGFINIISPEYLLKDYMADNASIFEADPKAIPYIVADYARTERNVILRLVLMMSTFTVSRESIIKEFSLIGIEVYNLTKQLWYEIYKCYADTGAIASLPSDYKEAVEEAYTRSVNGFTAKVLVCKEKYNMRYGKMETVYSVEDSEFISRCVSELESAGYVTEDEKGKEHYLGSELKGHIYQKHLPGQFFTFGGKYYEMQYLTADGQVLIRRAADHIYGRPAYRQIRNYEISGTRPVGRIGASRDVAGMKVVREYADICVKTPGYYRMNSYKNFEAAEKISFDDISGIPERIYYNKEILRIELPSTDGQVNDEVRYTTTVLFNEIFRTLFADNQPFITAVTYEELTADNGKFGPLTASITGTEGYELSRNSIYIIEDSQLDLGLLVAVERNLRRIFSIMQDYLSWHAEKEKESLDSSENTSYVPPVVSEQPTEKTLDNNAEISVQVEKKKGLFSKRKKNNNQPEETSVPETDKDEEPVVRASVVPKIRFSISYGSDEPPVDDEPADKTEGSDYGETAEPIAEEIPQEPAEETEPVQQEEEQSDDGIQDAEQPISADIPEPVQPVKNISAPFERSGYHERHYMLFGGKEANGINTTSSLDYLNQLGFGSGNSLKRARNGRNITDRIVSAHDPSTSNGRFCDFCGCEILGVEYETLVDGRDRCMSCGRTAIKTEEDFKALFEDVKRNMESFFGIKINAGIRVEMVNSKNLHKRIGKSFVPTPGGDGRVLGVAISDKNGFSLLIENGSPRISSMLTMAHELTHIWQYINWRENEISDKYGKESLDEIYEGMAKWVEVQYAYLINEPVIARREEIRTANRNDVYGKGFIRFCQVYPFSKGTVLNGPTPFYNVQDPLDPRFFARERVPVAPQRNNKEKKKDRVEKGKSSKGNIVKGIIILAVIALLLLIFTRIFDKAIPGTEPDFSASVSQSEKTTQSDSEPVKPNSSKSRFYYNMLGADEKKAYDAVSQAVLAFDDSIDTVPVILNTDDWEKVYQYFLLDNPHIDWLATRGCVFHSLSGKVTNLTFRYVLNKSEADKRNAEVEKIAANFISGLGSNPSEFDKALAVFEYLVNSVDYDSVTLEKHGNDNNYGMTDPDDMRTVYGALKGKKVVCAGYAAAAKYLFEQMGMECIYVTGFGEGEAHGWNLVKIDGAYYYMDITWADSSNTDPKLDQGDSISYEYFAMTTEQLLREHKLDYSDAMPLCNKTDCNYFVHEGYYLEEYDLNKIKEMAAQNVKNKSKSNQICFSDKDLFRQAQNSLLGYEASSEIIEYVNSVAGTSYTTYSITPSSQLFALGFNFR